MIEIRSFTTGQAPAGDLPRIRRLLDEAFEGDFSGEDWEHALGGHHVVVVERGALVAHAAVVPRELEIGGRPFRAGYVEAVGTAPARRRRGFGLAAMRRVGEILRAELELGALSTREHGFYERLGWERWRGPSFVRRADQRVRTQEEDDGLMVLRFGPSRDLDLGASIVCASRTGDDW